MDKLAVGPGYPEGVIDLNKSVADNVRAVAKAKGVQPNEIITCVLDRPRHEKLIAELRALGCGVNLIPDGDVAGVIAVTDPRSEEHTSELQSLMRISYCVLCFKKKNR